MVNSVILGGDLTRCFFGEPAGEAAESFEALFFGACEKTLESLMDTPDSF